MKKLVKIRLPESYYKKWNEFSRDFYTFIDAHSDVNEIIVIDEEDVKNYTLFRIGGLYSYNPNANYNMLIRYEEDFYPDSITKDPVRKLHLQGTHVVVDKNGETVYKQKRPFNFLYFIGNVLIKENNVGFYNLITKTQYDESYTDAFVTKKNIIIHSYKKSAIIINNETGAETIIE